MRRLCPHRSRKGFTIVEMLVAIAVMGIITAIAVPNFRGMLRKNKGASATRHVIGDLRGARMMATSGSMGLRNMLAPGSHLGPGAPNAPPPPPQTGPQTGPMPMPPPPPPAPAPAMMAPAGRTKASGFRVESDSRYAIIADPDFDQYNGNERVISRVDLADKGLKIVSPAVGDEIRWNNDGSRGAAAMPQIVLEDTEMGGQHTIEVSVSGAIRYVGMQREAAY